MIRFRLGDTNVRVHALALLMLALSFALGARAELAAMLTALFLHEGAHLLAARLLRVRVEGLDLMPFGGALTLENPYRMGSGSRGSAGVVERPAAPVRAGADAFSHHVGSI